MPDVMFVRGYGFPKGSKMDFAGYAGRSAFAGYGDSSAIDLPEAALFAPIPALDGYEGYGDTPSDNTNLQADPNIPQAGWTGGGLGILPLAGLALIAYALFSSGK